MLAVYGERQIEWRFYDMRGYGDYERYTRELNRYLKEFIIPLIVKEWSVEPPDDLKVRITSPMGHSQINAEAWTNSGDNIIYLNEDRLSDSNDYQTLSVLLHEAAHQILVRSIPDEIGREHHSPLFSERMRTLGVVVEPNSGVGIGIIGDSPFYNLLNEHQILIPSQIRIYLMDEADQSTSLASCHA